MEAFRWRAGFPMPLRDCDLLVSMALRFHTGWPCLLTPADSDPETRVNFRELPAPHSMSAAWQAHIDRRKEFVRRGLGKGWTPLGEAAT